MNRAMTSAPPPDPAGMMNSTGLSGTQALAVPMEVNTNAKEHATTRPIFRPENLFPMDEPSQAFFLMPGSIIPHNLLLLSSGSYLDLISFDACTIDANNPYKE
ncbi:hypothetical protein [Candidatus Deferrimicrobium sp.]|uniref:hypothetical protein n=1 Tax=Candidatus Deferrimicrobium sp. TaxID=3060586 RepID=UPI002ED7FA3C